MSEVWLRGPVEGVPPVLQPAAHAFLQAAEDLERAASDLTAEQLWARPGGAASVGFHLKDIAGATDRLLTYARGERLAPDQVSGIELEREPGDPPADAATLVVGAKAAIERAVETLRSVPVPSLSEPRTVGRAALPTNVFGLLCHAAEHAQRHTGQVITTAKIVRGG